MAQKTWIGGTYGLFLTGTNWSPSGAPGAGDAVVIATPTTDVALLPTTDVVYLPVNSLSLAASDTLAITAGNTLSLLDSGTTSSNAGVILVDTSNDRNAYLGLHGNLVNTGTVLLTGTGETPFIYVYGPSTTLSGGGTIAMAATLSAVVVRTGVTLDNADNLIIGSGRIVVDSSAGLVNASTIASSGTYGLTIIAQSLVTNTGLIESTSSAALSLNQGTIVNTGGTIAATGSGAEVELIGADVMGGTLATAGGGVVTANPGPGGTLDGVVNTGTVLVVSTSRYSAYLELANQVTNRGTIVVDAVGTFAVLGVRTPSVTLTGGGTIDLSGRISDEVNGAAATLDNVDNLIIGNGAANYGIDEMTLSLINGGTIDATRQMDVQAGSGLTNTGLIEATGGGALYVYGNTHGVVTNTGGTIGAFGTGSSLVLSQSLDLLGGTLASSGGGVIQDLGSNSVYTTLDGSGTHPITITAGSNVDVRASSIALLGTIAQLGTLTATGALTLSGAVQIGSGGSVGVSGTIAGAGTFALASGAVLSSGSAVAASQTILFAGTDDTLVLSQPGSFAGTLSNFSSTGTVDLASITATGATVTGSVLSLFDGAADLGTIALADFSGGSLATGSDGHGGTDVTAAAAVGGPKTWIGPAAGSFLTAADWSPSGVPGAGDDVVIDSGADVSVPATSSAALSINSITLATGNTLSIDGGTFSVLDTVTTADPSGTSSNAGTIAVATATLDLAGPLVGTGSALLGSNAVLAAGAVAAGQTVVFAGSADTLVLSQPGAFAGTLSGLDTTGTIDIAELTVTGATVTGDVLVLLDGDNEIGTIALADFAGGTFATSSDGQDGTDLTVHAVPTGEKVWEGPAVGSFLTAADWSPAGVPAVTDDVIIASGADVTVPGTSTALSINSLALAAGNTLSINGGAFAIFDAVTSNDAAGTSFNAGLITVGAASLALAGTLVQSGRLAVAGGGLLTSDGATVAGGGTLALSSGAVVAGSGLDNGNAIVGAGSLGDGVLTIVNEIAGSIVATTGTLTVDAGSGTIVNAGLIEADGFPLLLDAGSLANSGTVAALGAPVSVAAGQGTTLAAGTWIAAGATLALAGAAVTDDAADIVLSGSAAGFLSGPSATALELSLLQIDTVGTLELAAGRVFSSGVGLVNAGTLLLAGGRLADTGTAAFVNQGLITGGGTVSGTTENSGTILAAGSVLSLGAVSGSGAMLIGGGGSLILGGGVAGGTVEFSGTGALTIGEVGSFSDSIAGFGHGDVIDLATIPAIGSISFNPGTDVLSLFTVRSASTGSGPAPGPAATVTLSGTYSAANFSFRPDSSGQGTDILPCFVAGTRLLTTRGEVAVERLRIGDVAITESGSRPIVWIGERAVACDDHPQPGLIRPVRIRAGAFGPRQPGRDLLLSPDHAVAWDGVLIPVKFLLNGTSVVQERVSGAHYFHVELDAHDVVLSDNLWTESYLDTGNRGQFSGGSVISLRADFAAGWARLCCAGPAVDAARAHLRRLARREDYAPALVVRAGGRSCGAVRRQGALHRFLVPADTDEVTILSSTGVAAGGDGRVLGACIAGIVAADRPVALDDPSLVAGFYRGERDRGGAWRWTDGAGRLRLPRRAAPWALDLRVTRIMAGHSPVSAIAVR